MTSKISVLRASLTGFAGLVGMGIAAIVVAAVCLLPLPRYTAEAMAVDVLPVAGEQSRVCSGSLLQVLPQSDDATSYFSTGEPAVFTDVEGAALQSRELDAVDVTQADTSASPSVISVPAAGEGEPAPLLAGMQLQQVATEDLAGLAASACAEPSSEAWLVGGATEVGRTTLILLSNPTEVTATVTLEVFGDNGAVSTPNADGILVEPGQQRVLSLAAYAPDLMSPVVHVMSSGGLIQASLQQSVIRALVPGGVEIITPSASPNTTQIMTGVALTGLTVHDIEEQGLITSDVEPTIRIAVPGAVAADVVMTVIGQGAENIEIRTTIEAHHTLQLPFTGIADGMYTVVVEGTQPLVAGVRSVQAATVDSAAIASVPVTVPAPTDQSGGEGFNGGTATTQEGQGSAPAQTTSVSSGGDFAWHSSAQALTGDVLLPVAAGPSPTLTLYNPLTTSTQATLVSAGAADQTILVAPGGMTTVPLAALTRYTLMGAAHVHAAVTYAAPGVGAAVAVSPANPRGAALRVFPR
jgi:hypothetical protein